MASRSLNRVVLIGNLTRDPELKYTPAGTAVCTFGVATNRSWTTTDGQTKEETQFHRIVAWQKLAELCGKLLTKGRKVFCEGRITYRTFVGKDGQQRTIAEIVLDDFIVFGDGKRMVEPETKEELSTVEETASEKKPSKSAFVKASSSDKPARPAGGSTEDKSEDKKEKKDEDTSSSAEATEDKDETVNPDDIPF